jgi:DNA-directed RNA polymerase specialized sigma24 family protein
MAVESRDMREVIREEPLRRREILMAVADGPRTVPEIAAVIGCPTHEVMYWVMGMRKYGYLGESSEADDDGLFHYRALERITP